MFQDLCHGQSYNRKKGGEVPNQIHKSLKILFGILPINVLSIMVAYTVLIVTFFNSDGWCRVRPHYDGEYLSKKCQAFEISRI